MDKHRLLLYVVKGLDICDVRILKSLFITYNRSLLFGGLLENIKFGPERIQNILFEYFTKSEVVELSIMAVKQCGLLLRNIPSEFRYLEICEAAVKQDGYSLRSVPLKKRTYEICLAAVNSDEDSIRFVPFELMTKEQEMNIYTAAARKNSSYINCIPQDIAK